MLPGSFCNGDNEYVCKKQTIRDFINAWNDIDTRMTSNTPVFYPDWSQRFIKAGYHEVVLHYDDFSDCCVELMKWCDDHIGYDNYAWVSGHADKVIFWFNDEETAFWFALRWT